MGDDGAFGGEAFCVLCLFFEVREGDEEGKVCVLVAGGFELPVELLLNEFPNAVAPWFDDHAATSFGVFCEISSFDDLLIPFGEILSACGVDGSFIFRHGKVDRVEEGG